MQKQWIKPSFDDLARFCAQFTYGPGCWLWHGSVTKTGYGRFRWQGKTWLANRLVLIFQNDGMEETEKFAIHKCGNPLCVSTHHLQWGSAAENHLDSVRHHTFHHGERTKTSKLKKSQVIRGFKMYHEEGASIERVARFLGISKTQVLRIVDGAAWARETSKIELAHYREKGATRRRSYRKFSDGQIKEIWNMWHVEGHTQASIAKKFKTTSGFIGRILIKKDYIDVTEGWPILRVSSKLKDKSILSKDAFEKDAQLRLRRIVRCNSTLTTEKVLEIWHDFHSSKISQKELGAKFGVSAANISSILTRSTWADVTEGLRVVRPPRRWRRQRSVCPK